MKTGWLPCLLYSLLSGLTEIVPVSSRGHELLWQRLTGMEQQPLLQLLVHAGTLLGLWLACRGYFSKLRREKRLARGKRQQTRQPDPRFLCDDRLLHMAAMPMLLSFLLQPKAASWGGHLSLLAIFFLLGGILLFVPRLLPAGNKDSRSLSAMDSLLIGLSGALGILPGFSRVGAAVSAAQARGTDRERAVELVLALDTVAMLGVLVWDAVALAGAGMPQLSAAVVISGVLAAVFACIGARLGVILVRFLAVKTGFSGFAYYCWGAALFTFLIFLIGR